jgi:hypothetical protein
MNHLDWEEFYLLAAKEVNGRKIPERIAATRAAIRGRLLHLAESSDHHAERERMHTTMQNLDVLESSTKNW